MASKDNKMIQAAEIEEIAVSIGETSEFTFKIQIEGTNERPQHVRLMFETSDRLLGVHGQTTEVPGIYRFVVPEQLTRNFSPDNVVRSTVEVCIENKHFAPVNFMTRFKQPISVVVNSVNSSSMKPGLSESLKAHNEPQKTVRAERISTQNFKTLREKHIAGALSKS